MIYYMSINTTQTHNEGSTTMSVPVSLETITKFPDDVTEE